MCVAYPGKVLTIENDHAQVDFTGSVVPVNISMVSVEPGDYVLVHAGMAIQKVETEEAKEWIALFRDLEEASEMESEEGSDFPGDGKNSRLSAQNAGEASDHG